MAELMQQLRYAYEHLKSGDKSSAADILFQVLLHDENNVDAWWLVAHAVDSTQEKREALEHVLWLRPDHESALQKLAQLEHGQFDETPVGRREVLLSGISRTGVQHLMAGEVALDSFSAAPDIQIDNPASISILKIVAYVAIVILLLYVAATLAVPFLRAIF